MLWHDSVSVSLSAIPATIPSFHFKISISAPIYKSVWSVNGAHFLLEKRINTATRDSFLRPDIFIPRIVRPDVQFRMNEKLLEAHRVMFSLCGRADPGTKHYLSYFPIFRRRRKISSTFANVAVSNFVAVPPAKTRNGSNFKVTTHALIIRAWARLCGPRIWLLITGNRAGKWTKELVGAER